MAGINSLTEQLVQTLETYTQDVSDEVAKVVEDVGRQSLTMVKSAAPRRTGKYKRSLMVEIRKSKSITYSKVYARSPHERLTHLLENGHKTVKKSGKYGNKDRVAGQPHFAPAQSWADKEVMRKIEEVLKK